ncbi:chemotaxis protein CheD [Candidatus Sumerlaeota bacterium]|nr:chemotaxis protein CheD [Candidatus Sumerlaeota bacterium]
MPIVKIDIAEMQISNNPNDILMTQSLGSCVGLALYDPEVKLGALLHYMLPLSKVNPKMAARLPFMFADTGVPLFFRKFFDLGGQRVRTQVRIAGASQIMTPDPNISTGKRNLLILKKMFMKSGIQITSEDTGGNENRKLKLEISNGRCTVDINGVEKEL